MASFVANFSSSKVLYRYVAPLHSLYIDMLSWQPPLRVHIDMQPMFGVEHIDMLKPTDRKPEAYRYAPAPSEHIDMQLKLGISEIFPQV